MLSLELLHEVGELAGEGDRLGFGGGLRPHPDHGILRMRDENLAYLDRTKAERLLTPEEKKIIEQFAMPRYYQQMVTEAGGSVEQARRKAKAEGDDLRHVNWKLFANSGSLSKIWFACLE